jgi:hypothetical protein
MKATALALSVLGCMLLGCASEGSDEPNTPLDANPSCDPLTVLPTSYRPIPTTSTGAVALTTTAHDTTGTIDATAGGLSGAADNPYVYVDLITNTRVDVSDVNARDSLDWDIALKRSSLRINGGDSGGGRRTLAIAAGATSVTTVTAPSSGYTEDDFTSDDCMLATIPGGEPMSAFGEWYEYDVETHAVTPKTEVYVLQRPDGSRTALRIVTYYGDTAMPMRGAFYRIETKQLDDAP